MSDEQAFSIGVRDSIVASLESIRREADLVNADSAIDQIDWKRLATAIHGALTGLAAASDRLPVSSGLLRQLDKLLRVSDGVRQWESIHTMLAEISSDEPGWQAIQELIDGRLQRWQRKFSKCKRRLNVERFDDQVHRLATYDVAETGQPGETRIRASHIMQSEWDRVRSALACDEPSVTLIHELHDSVNKLYHQIQTFRGMFEADERFLRFENSVVDLYALTQEVLHWGLIKSQCTKRIEKQREQPAVEMLRRLKESSTAKFREAFSALVAFLDSQPFGDTVGANVFGSVSPAEPNEPTE